MSSWADLIAHARVERDSFKKRAAAARKNWLEARRKRRWLDAIEFKSRESEYRQSAAQRQAFIDEHSFHVRATHKEKPGNLS